MTRDYRTIDSSEHESDIYYDYYEEEVISEEFCTASDLPGEDETFARARYSGHPFDESTAASHLTSTREEHKAEIVLHQSHADPPESRFDRLEPTGELRRGIKPPTGRSSRAPAIVQRPVLLPQELSYSSSTTMPREQSSSGSQGGLPLERAPLVNSSPSAYGNPAQNADKQSVALAVTPTQASSVVEIEEDHPLPNQIVCYRGNALVPHKGQELVMHAPPKYLHETEQDRLPWRLRVCLLLLFFLVIALAVTAALLWFVFLKDGEPDNVVPTMTPTAAGQPDALTISCPGIVATMTEEAVAKYEKLTTELIVTQVYSSWDYSIDSCHPANQAAVWLSTGSEEDHQGDWLQRYILAFQYFAAEGDSWFTQAKWLSHNESVCSWFGIGCTSEGTVVKIDLSSNSLRGPMISELGLLSKLRVLSLGGNALNGPISFVAGLSDLHIINLEYNRLIGRVPNMSAPYLEFLNLHDNVLSGEIPPSLGGSTLLKKLDLGRNNFRGTIPGVLNNLTRLASLSFESNTLLTGRIATEFARFSDLQQFSISNTDIRARIPLQYGALTKLEELRMANTLVGGDIPASVANMTRLRHVDLSGSRFRKAVPSFLGTLTKLTHLSLHNNSLTGEVPTELGALSNLTLLSLDGNAFVGTVSSELGLMSKLEALTLHGNELITGRVPEELCRLRERDLEIFTTSCPIRTEQGDQLGVTCAVPLCCSACIGPLG